MLLLIIVLMAIQFFQVSDPDSTVAAASLILKKTLGIKIIINKQAVTATLWFALLVAVMRYFQTNIYINRLYNYVHKLEDQLAVYLGQGVIDREGKSYLHDYPVFSNWVQVIYTWFFPFLLIFTSIFKIYNDFPGCSNVGFSYLMSILFFLSIFISTIFYLIFLHLGK